ncbi:hypothetical protein K438DRAFT_2019749 [Mycena galopus ATCC 62051]|nr:hypothetical protein K438DRAFT_2019749 [Mycena galopus ATCC 62051]
MILIIQLPTEKPIIDLVKKIVKLTLFLPETVPLATEEDDIPLCIFELEGEDGTVASTFNCRVNILFGEHVRDSDGRLKYMRRGNLGMDCVVKYLESIHWESTKILLDLAQGKLVRITDELDYLCGGDREPTKLAGKIADLRLSFTKDAGYEQKMDMFFAASTTTQKKSKLKSTNETDDSEDDFDDVIEIDCPDPPAVKDTFSQLATLKHNITGSVLQMLTVHIFGILANSMPDERMNSNITWFNSPLQGNQKAENLLDMILVRQWHTYHTEDVKVRCPRQNSTVAFRRLNPELLEKVKHKATDHSNSDSETNSDSDKESDSPTVITESVPSNTVISAPAIGEEPSHSEDEEANRIRHRYHRKKRAAKMKGKKKVFPSHTTFNVDPDINLHSAGLKELLSDEPSALKTHAAVVISVGASSSDNQDLWEGW